MDRMYGKFLNYLDNILKEFEKNFVNNQFGTFFPWNILVLFYRDHHFHVICTFRQDMYADTFISPMNFDIKNWFSG